MDLIVVGMYYGEWGRGRWMKKKWYVCFIRVPLGVAAFHRLTLLGVFLEIVQVSVS